jgi:serine/threonine protein kinase
MLICCGLPELLNVGPYQVIERIGRGGMALVLQVRDRHTKHIYALKLLAEIDSLNDVLRQRFLREMDAVRELAHPNIAVARTVGQHGRFLYIAMEWVQGCNLAQYVHDNGPLPAATAVNLIRQASEALQYAHERGLVHRDVKPANLIWGSNGEVKLVDMGLARFVDVIEQHMERRSNHWKTDTGHLMGTIDYMAPEQALDLSLADHRSDIYSLGCTLFYLLTGETHLRGSTQRRRAVSLVNKSGMRDLRDVKEGLDPCIYALVKKMIKVSPQDRFQSIKELLVAIDECATQFGLPSLLDKAYRVLVVEDSPTQAMITCEQLKATSRHFIPVDVATLAMACDRLLAEAFDVVLLDLNLPDSSGIETITSVRQANGTVPILVLTSNNDPTVGVKCIEAGADDFLPKDALDVLTLERHILLTMSRREITVL